MWVQEPVEQEGNAAVHGKDVEMGSSIGASAVQVVGKNDAGPVRTHGRHESHRGPHAKSPEATLPDRRRTAEQTTRRRKSGPCQRPAHPHAPETAVNQP